ncbi:hypothetical protein [Rhodoplanes sp. SY1]|uniref:hypothetical protein n=1 Tax=Rhodoplanes sp. SY1 TaxID=3166646 RepID=UPI0038B6541C
MSLIVAPKLSGVVMKWWKPTTGEIVAAIGLILTGVLMFVWDISKDKVTSLIRIDLEPGVLIIGIIALILTFIATVRAMHNETKSSLESFRESMDRQKSEKPELKDLVSAVKDVMADHLHPQGEIDECMNKLNKVLMEAKSVWNTCVIDTVSDSRINNYIINQGDQIADAIARAIIAGVTWEDILSENAIERR